jgi:hypothetical protein
MSQPQVSVDVFKSKLNDLYKNSKVLSAISSNRVEQNAVVNDAAYISAVSKEEKPKTAKKMVKNTPAKLEPDIDSDELAYMCFQSEKKKPKKRSKPETEEKLKSRMKILKNRSLLDSCSPVVEARNESDQIISTTGRKLIAIKKVATKKASKVKKTLF